MFPCPPQEFPHHPVVGTVVVAGFAIGIYIPNAESLII